MDSGKRINYNLRAAKSVERKMICESFRRLASFRQVESYQYVGFGSYYFNDFKLFHKDLNLCKMTSIEKNTNDKRRFDFNKPFNCIDIKYGKSGEKLQEIQWQDSPAIVWLDYDTVLDEDKLEDIRYLCSKLMGGSILIVTVNAHPWAINEMELTNTGKPDEGNVGASIATSPTLPIISEVLEPMERGGKVVAQDVRLAITETTASLELYASLGTQPETPIQSIVATENHSSNGLTRYKGRLNILAENVGENNIPPEVKEKDLRKWGLAKVSARIVLNQIEQTIAQRNGPLHEVNKLQFKQLYNFHYEDGAKMLTIGGIIYDKGSEPLLLSCGFERLPYIKTNDEPFLIEVPNLTYHEIRYLNSMLPNGDLSEVFNIIPQQDVDRYKLLYRYFPAFTETDVS